MASENQQDEKLVELVKKHWMYLFRPLSLYSLGWGLCLTFFIFADALFLEWHNASMLFLLLAFLPLLVGHHWFFFYLLSRELSLIVITDKQILKFDYLPLIKKDLELVVVHNIDEIEEKQEGILQNIFHYGTVLIQTSSAPLPVLLCYIPHPTGFIRKIRALK
ncbi:hypothetical protein IPG41_05095 [Candidatus Peregrinibacteria bacterium]|nr:MAG: hypothetical protein IPG41_05095 [Candidatus Peregrinibacteria bacterium]